MNEEGQNQKLEYGCLLAALWSTPQLVSDLFVQARKMIAEGHGLSIFLVAGPISKLIEGWKDPEKAHMTIIRNMNFGIFPIRGNAVFFRNKISALDNFKPGNLIIVFVEEHEKEDEEGMYMIGLSENGFEELAQEYGIGIPSSPVFIDWTIEPYDPEDLSVMQLCHVCRKDGVTKLCAGCGAFRYCSVECQRVDWPIHKQECKLLFQMCSHKSKWLE